MAVPTITEDSTAPRSSHVSDPTLQAFLQPTFDPADYLNTTLPSLSLSSVSSRPLKQGTSVPLAELSSQTNDLLSQLNAHTTRLSTILTQLTDDILRSGGRLAYEVEVLRGETLGLSDTLTESLNPDIKKFVPDGISLSKPDADNSNSDGEPPEPFPTLTSPSDPKDRDGDIQNNNNDETPPDHITPLRTLTLVRARLDSVIQIFGEAMHWTLPPSETSLTSSLISVTSPAPSSSATDPATLESRGQAFATSLRSEIADLIINTSSSTDGADTNTSAGFTAAQSRIAALRDLATVWKGTAEEKARIKFVDSLVKLAEEKQRERENAWNQRQQQARPGRSGSVRKDRDREKESGRESGREQHKEQQQKEQQKEQQKTGGFLDNLQRIRGNIYLD
jgi:hypothetical protein